MTTVDQDVEILRKRWAYLTSLIMLTDDEAREKERLEDALAAFDETKMNES